MPLSSFKFSSSPPCLSYTEEPASNQGQVTDEYTYSKNGCTKDPFYGQEIDTRYTLVEGFIPQKQTNFETANGITDILTGRFFGNDPENFDALQKRKDVALNLYAKQTIGWKIECENDPNETKNLSR